MSSGAYLAAYALVVIGGCIHVWGMRFSNIQNAEPKKNALMVQGAIVGGVLLMGTGVIVLTVWR